MVNWGRVGLGLLGWGPNLLCLPLLHINKDNNVTLVVTFYSLFLTIKKPILVTSTQQIHKQQQY